MSEDLKKVKDEGYDDFVPFYQKASDELNWGKISKANLDRNMQLIKDVSKETGFSEEEVLEELESYFNSIRYGIHNSPTLSIDLGFGRLKRKLKNMEKMTRGKYFTERFFKAVQKNAAAYYKYWEVRIMSRKYNAGWTPKKFPKKVLKKKTYVPPTTSPK